MLHFEGIGMIRKFMVDVSKTQFENVKKRYNHEKLKKKAALP